MLEQIRKFRVTALTVQGFKGHKDPVTYQFGDLNEITGHMGVGKSSIADAIAFAITGVTFFGSSKLDSLYHNGQRDLLVDMSFDGDDEKAHRLVRRRVNDNMRIFSSRNSMTSMNNLRPCVTYLMSCRSAPAACVLRNGRHKGKEAGWEVPIRPLLLISNFFCSFLQGYLISCSILQK